MKTENMDKWSGKCNKGFDENRKRILQANIDNNGGNGAFSLMRYLYQYLSEDFIFDYYTMDCFIEDSVYSAIKADGGICYSANLRRNKLLGHILLPFNFYKVLERNQYDVVHIHSEVAYKHFLYSIAAQAAKIKKIVIHSHSSNIDGEYQGFKYLFHKMLRGKVNKYGTFFLACSLPAAKWMFTKETLNSRNFSILQNGIATEKYLYSDETRTEVRNELGLNSEKIIGHVGTFKKVKNQKFLIDIISILKNRGYKLILVGDGDDKEKLIAKAREMRCLDSIIFTGNRTDVNRVLQAMDIFVMPSLFEGIPMALIEAQAIGLPIIASDVINHDVKINENVEFVSLDKDKESWIAYIEKNIGNHFKKKGFIKVSESPFDIKKSANQLAQIYKY